MQLISFHKPHGVSAVVSVLLCCLNACFASCTHTIYKPILKEAGGHQGYRISIR